MSDVRERYNALDAEEQAAFREVYELGSRLPDFLSTLSIVERATLVGLVHQVQSMPDEVLTRLINAPETVEFRFVMDDGVAERYGEGWYTGETAEEIATQVDHGSVDETEQALIADLGHTVSGSGYTSGGPYQGQLEDSDQDFYRFLLHIQETRGEQYARLVSSVGEQGAVEFVRSAYDAAGVIARSLMGVTGNNA